MHLEHHSQTESWNPAKEGEGPHPREIKEIMGKDQAQRMDRCSEKGRVPVVVDIAQVVRWEKLWDAALDEGPRCIQWMKLYATDVSETGGTVHMNM